MMSDDCKAVVRTSYAWGPNMRYELAIALSTETDGLTVNEIYEYFDHHMRKGTIENFLLELKEEGHVHVNEEANPQKFSLSLMDRWLFESEDRRGIIRRFYDNVIINPPFSEGRPLLGMVLYENGSRRDRMMTIEDLHNSTNIPSSIISQDMDALSSKNIVEINLDEERSNSHLHRMTKSGSMLFTKGIHLGQAYNEMQADLS